MAFYVNGNRNIKALVQGLNGVIHYHEMLRIHIEDINGEPVQIINPNLTLTLDIVDLHTLSDYVREEKIKDLTTEERPPTLTYDMHHC